MANYHRGRRREWAVRNILRLRGYYVVRSAGSKGAADLVASNESEIIYIQVGDTKSKNLHAATEKLLTVKLPPFVKRQIWRIDERGEWQVEDVNIPF